MSSPSLLSPLMRSGAAVCGFDRDGRYVFINDAAQRIIGAPREQVLGTNYLDRPREQRSAELEQAFQGVVADGVTRQLRVRARGRHYEIDISTAEDLVVVLWRDITDIVRAHVATTLERDRWQILFEQAPAQISVTMGPEHRCIYVNERARAALGGRTDLVGKTPRESFPELADSPLHAVLDEVYRTGVPFIGKDMLVPFEDEERYFTFVYQPFRDETHHVVGMMTFGFEVTDTVKARRRLETMFEANLVGNIAWKIDGTITSANDAFLRTLGYSRDEFVTLGLSWRTLTPPDFEELDRVYVEELVRERRHRPYEKVYLRKDGSRAPVLVSTAFFPDSDEEGISYVVDLSQVKEAETRIRALLTEAQAASRAKDQFLAMLGHELRNPLAPIATAVELMRMRGAAGAEVATLERQVAHLSRLVDDLLDIARITRGEMTIEKRDADLRRVIERAIEMAEPIVEKHRHTLTVSFGPGTFVLRGDEARLAQAVSNLVINAARYTSPGGKIDVSVTAGEGTARIVVRDTGRGIRKEALPHIFEPFYRTQPGGEVGGLGLGLAIVRTIVGLHEGQVTAASEGEGMGSELVIALPIVAHAEKPSPPRDVIAETARRVLIVDDNVDAAAMLADVIALHGHHVQVANDGPEAIRVADAFRPEVVLLDLSLPVMDGFEIARELRARHGGAMRLVALTGLGQPGDRTATTDAGFDGHLVKPVAVDLVLRQVALAPTP